MTLDDWPNCPTPDCEHKCCLWAATGLCHHCSVRLLGADEMERRYASTHAENDDGENWTGPE